MDSTTQRIVRVYDMMRGDDSDDTWHLFGLSGSCFQCPLY